MASREAEIIDDDEAKATSRTLRIVSASVGKNFDLRMPIESLRRPHDLLMKLRACRHLPSFKRKNVTEVSKLSYNKEMTNPTRVGDNSEHRTSGRSLR